MQCSLPISVVLSYYRYQQVDNVAYGGEKDSEEMWVVNGYCFYKCCYRSSTCAQTVLHILQFPGWGTNRLLCVSLTMFLQPFPCAECVPRILHLSQPDMSLNLLFTCSSNSLETKCGHQHSCFNAMYFYTHSVVLKSSVNDLDLSSSL